MNACTIIEKIVSPTLLIIDQPLPPTFLLQHSVGNHILVRIVRSKVTVHERSSMVGDSLNRRAWASIAGAINHNKKTFSLHWSLHWALFYNSISSFYFPCLGWGVDEFQKVGLLYVTEKNVPLTKKFHKSQNLLKLGSYEAQIDIFIAKTVAWQVFSLINSH
jgi:hypothetical protein